jgi:uncharacterized membrane protein
VTTANAIPPARTASRPAWATDPLLWGALLLVGGVLGWLSIARYQGYNAGMLDLGNMAQAIWSATQGQPLIFTYVDGPTSRLAFHIELIYFLIAPLYALWSSPMLLLILQAGLFALGALPAYTLALRATESRFAARCIALIYLLYPVAQTSVLFDFHGDTLALPLLLFAVDAFDRRAWRAYTVFLVLALLCKFYVALPVFLLGLLIGWRDGFWRVALFTCAGAAIYGTLAFFVIRPAFTTETTSSAHRGLNYLVFYFGQLSVIWDTLGERLLNALIVFGPALLVAWRGWRWLLVGLPVALAMLISSGPGPAYAYIYHHYALVVPFIVLATIEGAQRMQQRAAANSGKRRGRSWRGDLGLTVAIVLLAQALLVDTPTNPLFWLGIPGQGLDSAQYGHIPRDDLKDRFLAEQVPPDAPLAASAFLGPHLANRATLYTVRYSDDPGGERLPTLLPEVDYVLADALFDWQRIVDGALVGGVAYEQAEIGLLLRDPDFGLVAARDGLLLFERDASAERTLRQEIEPAAPVPATTPVTTFAETIRLLDASIEPRGAGRYQASFLWSPARPLIEDDTLVAVSRLLPTATDAASAAPAARIVHLPTFALHAPALWQPGAAVRETFDVELPSDLAPGSYHWYVGWYATQHPDAYATDARSRLGQQEALVGTLVIE